MFVLLLIRTYEDGCYADLERCYLDAGAENHAPQYFLLLINSRDGFTARLPVVMLLEFYGVIWLTIDQ